jgi:hypothetical protein
MTSWETNDKKNNKPTKSRPTRVESEDGVRAEGYPDRWIGKRTGYPDMIRSFDPIVAVA